MNIKAAGLPGFKYPPTAIKAVTETLHSRELTDNYRWLEDSSDPDVKAWTEEQEKFARSFLSGIKQKNSIARRLDQLWRYDDETVPYQVLNGDRIFYWSKKKEQEKWIFMTREREGADAQVLIDPNKWDSLETLHGVSQSRNGEYITYGVARGGDENPRVSIMEVSTGNILPDTLRGWKQYVNDWLPDHSGFFYSCHPLKGEVPEGEEYFWNSVYLHKLGDPAEKDVRVFFDPDIKEIYHSVSVSEDGNYIVLYKWRMGTNSVYIRKLSPDAPLISIVTGFKNSYSVYPLDDKILIFSDEDAPRSMVFITSLARPEREHWIVFIPQHDTDKLEYISAVGGYIYAIYSHNTYNRIMIYNLEGEFIREMKLPTLGSASVSGYWSREKTWVYFSSFTYPPVTFTYNPEADSLTVYKEFPVKINTGDYEAELVWYPSVDGTLVSMYLLYRKGLERNGENPVLLTGYGGFRISQQPAFSTFNVLWLESGGMLAIPHLRGGGEYGREWHDAGRLDKKQNVFDDFISAAEWLIVNKYTSPAKLAISGGSNGGLLVGAVTVQRPELFKAVLCSNPLLDMIRYHKFGLANIWAEEYGSSDDPDQFRYLLDYSPYHNVKEGVEYPAILLVGSENDARVDPLHVRKMAAILQYASSGKNPVMVTVLKASGHSGGTTISEIIDQYAQEYAFLMHFLGMKGPEID
ncbi:S9 family peptidase [bacterium]|nr:S9 family peptidase [bacterium]